MATIEVRTVSRVPPATGFDIIRVADGEKIHSSALDALVADGNTVLVVGKTGTRPWRGKTSTVHGDTSRGFTTEDRDRIDWLGGQIMDVEALLYRVATGVEMLLRQQGLEFPGGPELPASDEATKPGEALDEPPKEC